MLWYSTISSTTFSGFSIFPNMSSMIFEITKSDGFPPSMRGRHTNIAQVVLLPLIKQVIVVIDLSEVRAAGPTPGWWTRRI